MRDNSVVNQGKGFIITNTVHHNYMAILVTGGTGLVGSHLIRRLVAKGEKVKALYRNAIPPVEFATQVEWVRGDVLDVVSLSKAMQEVQQVYHCAAIVSFSPGMKDVLNTTNIEGTKNVVNACLLAGVEQMLLVSSVAALGRMRPGEMIDETSKWSEQTGGSEYGKTKFLSEMEVWRGAAEGLKTVIVNPTIILGAGDWNKGSSELFKSAYSGFKYYTEGVSGFVYVEDVVSAMIMLMENKINDQRFLLNGENLPFKEVFRAAATCFKTRAAYKRVSPLAASIVWRLEAFKSIFSGETPMLTKETAATAQAKVYFDNSKLLRQFPAFKYTPIKAAIETICVQLKHRYKLPDR